MRDCLVLTLDISGLGRTRAVVDEAADVGQLEPSVGEQRGARDVEVAHVVRMREARADIQQRHAHAHAHHALVLAPARPPHFWLLRLSCPYLNCVISTTVNARPLPLSLCLQTVTFPAVQNKHGTNFISWEFLKNSLTVHELMTTLYFITEYLFMVRRDPNWDHDCFFKVLSSSNYFQMLTNWNHIEKRFTSCTPYLVANTSFDTKTTKNIEIISAFQNVEANFPPRGKNTYNYYNNWKLRNSWVVLCIKNLNNMNTIAKLWINYSI